MASKYLIANGGNWTDTTKWAASDADAATNTNSSSTPTASDDVFLTANSGQCTISATSVGKSLNCTGYTNTFTHNGFALTISGSVTFVAGMTYTANSGSTFNINGTSTLTTGGQLIRTMTINGVTVTLGDDLNFQAFKTLAFTIGTSGASLNLGGFTLKGNSATNRILVQSSTLGTGKTLTVNGGTFENADFRDITFSSASSLDLSAITGLSGDCGGNTITGGGSTLTFTTPATQTATGNSANWSTTTWTSRVPLPQDDVVLSLTAGQTLTNDMPRMGKSISVTTGMILSANTIAQTNYGSIDFTNLTTFTSGTTGVWNLEGRGTYTITSNGKAFGGQCIFSPVSGSITLADAFSSGTNQLTSFVVTGTFNDGGFNITCRDITYGAPLVLSGVTTLNRTSSGVFANTSTTTHTGTFIISNTGSSSKTFAGGSATYNNLQITGGGTGAIIISGSNTFNTLTVNSPKTLTLTSGTTQTITDFVRPSDTGIITLRTSAAGAATIAKTSSIVEDLDYLSITNVNVTPSSPATWYYGDNSTYVSGTGWNSGPAPVANIMSMALMGIG